MKQQIKKWIFRIAVTALFILALLLVVIFNPVLTYANKTTHDNFVVFHDKPLDQTLLLRLDEATAILKPGEFYNTKLKLDICLNDGSAYPRLMQTLRGQAFAWGFYNKVVLQGTMNGKDNYVELNGYIWKLTQLLAHEITHCLQFDKLGLWRSKPFADIPNWKWEGYAEYASRQDGDQKDLLKNIDRLAEADRKDPNSWAITFADNTISPREYYNYWTLVQFCIDIKKMNYEQLLADTTKEEIVREEMMHWYSEHE